MNFVEVTRPSMSASVAKPRVAEGPRGWIATLSNVSVSNVARADWLGKSDPFVQLVDKETGIIIAKTLTVSNVTSATWVEPVSAPFQPGNPAGRVLILEVWDDDTHTRDDLLGRVEIPFKVFRLAAGAPPQEGHEAVHNKPLVDTPRGSASASISATILIEPPEKPPPDPPPPPSMPPSMPPPPPKPLVGAFPVVPVLRREFRDLSAAEQERVVNALHRMMADRDGPETSPYYNFASLHGWPKHYCEHGQESFPGWHRAYLCEFERAFQQADYDLNSAAIEAGSLSHLGWPCACAGAFEPTSSVMA